MNLNNKTLAEKLYLLAGVAAVISLFLPWVDLGILSANGFQQQGYLFLVLMIYPIYTVITEKSRYKMVSLGCGIVNTVFVFIFINSKSADFFGETINAAGIGLYVMLIASILMTIAAGMEFKEQA